MNQSLLTIRNQLCPNRHCHFHGLNLKGNIAIHGQKYPRFKCKQCGKTWVAHYQDFYFGFKTDDIKIRRALDLLKEGIPIRKIARITEVSSGTVMRCKRKLNKKKFIF